MNPGRQQVRSVLRTRSGKARTFALTPEGVGAWVLAAAVVLLLFWGLRLDWIPNDDGTLAHAADRVRTEQVPHLDFDEPYTGGLTYLNSVVLSADTSLLALRYPVVFLSLISGVIAYLFLRRSMPPLFVVGIVGSSLLLSLSLNSSPSPNWYNVYLGLMSLGALWLYLEKDRLLWLALAGLLIGLSLLAKVTGLFFGLAIAIVLATRASHGERPGDRVGGRLVLFLGVVGVTVLLASEPSVSRYMTLFAPIALVCLVGIGGRVPKAEVWSTPHHLHVELGVLLMGAILPIGAFMLHYWSLEGLDDLFRGVLLASSGLIDTYSFDTPRLTSSFYLLVISGFVIVLSSLSVSRWAVVVFAITACAVLYGVVPGQFLLGGFYVMVWLPFACALLYVIAVLRGEIDLPAVVLVSGAVCVALVQFPTSGQYYTAYTTAVTLPAIGFLVFARSRIAGFVVVCVIAATAAAFTIGKIEGRVLSSGTLGEKTSRVPVATDRFGLRVAARYGYYSDVLETLGSRTYTGGDLIAGPSSPEVYFLSGAPNPTPLTLEHLGDFRDDALTTDDYIRLYRPDVIVANREPVIQVNPDAVVSLTMKCPRSIEHGPLRVSIDCMIP